MENSLSHLDDLLVCHIIIAISKFLAQDNDFPAF